MRIGIDYRATTISPWSGISRQIQGLEQALLQRADTELVLFSDAPLDHPHRQKAHCPEWYSPVLGLQRPQMRLRFEGKFLPAQMHRQAIDLFIATANMGLPIGRKPAGTRYVLVLHDLFQLTQHNYHRSRFIALAYRVIDAASIAWSMWIADQVWCPSQFTRNEAVRLFPWAKAKLRVFNHLVPEYREAPGELPSGTPARYWLVVGSREPRKNVVFFIENWHACRLQNPHVPELVLVGHAADVPSALAELPGLHWISDLEEPQLQALYANAECLWHPSYAEGFGMPVVEALSVGTPVAVARGSSLDEVAPHSARRFDPHDAAQLKTAMIELAQSDAVPDPEPLRVWARQFAEPAYRQRLDALLKELHR